jgi:peptide-methionine (S)-S-oxide reductase
MWFDKKTKMPTAAEALPGRSARMPVPEAHFVNGHPIAPPYPPGLERAMFGMGCFWGAERKFWQLPGVYTTAVGYAAGLTPNPTYREVCSGLTGHNEAVLVVFDPARVTYDTLLKVFWENHDPTQGMRQGNDVGTQYRSGIYVFDEAQRAAAEASRDAYQRALSDAGLGRITTEILPAPEFYFAEDYHQQYLAKEPGGYCGLGGTGVSCPAGVFAGTDASTAKTGHGG